MSSDIPVSLLWWYRHILCFVNLHSNQSFLESLYHLTPADDDLKGFVVPGWAEQAGLLCFGPHACVKDLPSGELHRCSAPRRCPPSVLRVRSLEIPLLKPVWAFNDCARQVRYHDLAPLKSLRRVDRLEASAEIAPHLSNLIELLLPQLIVGADRLQPSPELR